LPYKPHPIDTHRVRLTPDLLDLSELLAENTHDVWARLRLARGWRCGPKRDDTERKHPCLVPYDELPEAEKEYDRQVAVQTLKAILALGFTISRRRADIKHLETPVPERPGTVRRTRSKK
jgi:hypothetical protein